MNHIVMIGFMGSGKTRVGKRLSQDLGLPFVDVDKLIAKNMKMTKKEVYQRFGEPFYRALETRTIKELLEMKERMVVSLGAGLPVQEQNEQYLKQMGTIVYLEGSFSVLWNRINAGGGGENQEKMKKLLEQRTPYYRKFADITVVTGVKPFEDLVKEIEEKLEKAEKNS